MERERRFGRLPSYESLKEQYPNYNYFYVLNGQINPSNMPITHKVILDCGYMREFFNPAKFGRETLPVENILVGVPSFNMAFDEVLEVAKRDVSASLGLLTLTQAASEILDRQEIIKMVDKYLVVRAGIGYLTGDECTTLRFAVQSFLKNDL